MPEPLLYSSSRIPSTNLSRFHIVNGMSKAIYLYAGRLKQVRYRTGSYGWLPLCREGNRIQKCVSAGVDAAFASAIRLQAPAEESRLCRLLQGSASHPGSTADAPGAKLCALFARLLPPPNGLMRWIVRWRRWFCFLLNFVRLARPDCEHCNEYVECWGTDMRKRLDELR